MRRYSRILLSFVAAVLLLFVTVLPVLAEEASSSPDREKLLLARRLHEVFPIHEQYAAAVDGITQGVEPDKRMMFRAALMNAFSPERMEKISIDVMAELFTKEELQAMVDYYGLPVAQSIQKKMPEYMDRIRPEMFRMIDKALMQIKTGGMDPVSP